ncbi:bacterial alpha-L-rhamnosidase domain-containing protein [Mycena rebaudengoi]|nr:bacterial alpha-L-rhamnosidase domain-containing protein [Mycena rebaudengoi]
MQALRSPSVPKNQKIDVILETNFNAAFADVAEALKPTLYEWIDEPQEAICFVPDEAAYFKWRAEHRMTIGELEKHEWTKGDDFIVNFGGHRVGYLSFHLGAVGVNIDAPCRLRLVVPTDHLMRRSTSTGSVSLPRRAHPGPRQRPKFRVTFSRLRATAVSAVDPSAPLRAIDSAAMHTLRDCMHAVFEDGPRRDRRLWLGDLRLQALANYATFAHFALVKRCLYLFAAVPRTNASLPVCVYDLPALRGASDYIVDYDALFGVTLAEYVAASGDLETGRALWETALGSMRGPLAHIDPDTHRFVGARTSAWKICDWAEELHTDASMHGVVLLACKSSTRSEPNCSPTRHPPPFAGDVARMIARAAGFLREEEGQEPLFVSAPNAQVSWASAAWLSLSGAFHAPLAKRAPLAALAHPAALRPLTPYCFHHRECVALVREYWGGMLAAGADTFWECFDPLDARRSPYGDCHNNRYCHAWSCTPSYLLRVVLRDWFEKEGTTLR